MICEPTRSRFFTRSLHMHPSHARTLYARSARMKRAELLTCVALLALGSMLVFNTRLLGSSSLWCDPRVQERLAEKDRSVKQAMQQMQEALMQQEATLSALTKERAASHELRKKRDAREQFRALHARASSV